MAIVASHGNRPSPRLSPRIRLRQAVRTFAQRHPLLALLLLMIVSNVAGTAFNVFYNLEVIQKTDRQREVFKLAIPLYQAIAWPLCISAVVYLMRPLNRCLQQLRAGKNVDPAFLTQCRRGLVNLPYKALWVNAWGWLPGALYFPLVVTSLGGFDDWVRIWLQFPISFVISALITVAQTFFITETFLTAVLYPEFFRDARPEDVPGARRIPYKLRLTLLWLAVACMPLLAMFVALRDENNLLLPVVLLIATVGSSYFIFRVVGRDLLRWLQVHAQATDAIGHGNFDVRIPDQRPDEWGRLTNRFNDMAAALGRAHDLRETMGQFVSPEVCDEILENRPGLEVTVQEITVLFADIRGFTRRTAGAPPERVGVLLNRFLTLALRTVEEKGGLVNKFLGDGFMALFGATRIRDDHADLALASAQDLLLRLEALNDELRRQGDAPLVVGIGIHTGPALVGCFGAVLGTRDGREQMRREFTAIGETVNFCQRIEQLTKTHGGPILISDATRRSLKMPACLECLGPQLVPGAPEPLVVHRAVEAYNAEVRV